MQCSFLLTASYGTPEQARRLRSQGPDPWSVLVGLSQLWECVLLYPTVFARGQWPPMPLYPEDGAASACGGLRDLAIQSGRQLGHA